MVLEQLRLETMNFMEQNNKEAPMIDVFLRQKVFQNISNERIFQIGFYWPFENFVKLYCFIVEEANEKEADLAL